jgi:hypothetical protein
MALDLASDWSLCPSSTTNNCVFGKTLTESDIIFQIAILKMVTTEIFTMALAPGSDVGDPTTNAALIAWESFETIAKANGGHKINFGTQRESSQTFEVFISMWLTVPARNTSAC